MKSRKKSADEKRHDKFRDDVSKALSPIVSKFFNRKKSKIFLQTMSVSMEHDVMSVDMTFIECVKPIIQP